VTRSHRGTPDQQEPTSMDHRIPRRVAALLALVSGMLLAGLPAIAQEASPAAEPETAPAFVNSLDVLPAEVGGVPLGASQGLGTTLFSHADMDDPDVAQDVADFEAMLEAVDASVEQVLLTSAFAWDDDRGMTVSGIQVIGADAASFIEAWLDIDTRTDIRELRLEHVELGGKDVVVATDAVSPSIDLIYGYASRDTVWVLRRAEGDVDEWMVELLEALP
jgi:hypothetical protein